MTADTAEEDPVRKEEEEVQDQEEIEDESDSSVCSLKILPVTHELHQKHGLRHSDFQRYRGYCARRIARVRKTTKMVQGEKKKFIKKEVDAAAAEKDSNTLQIPLMTAERAWAYAMQLKFEMNTEPRKKFHMVSRLKKASKEAQRLCALVADEERCDARTKLETRAYAAWMTGTMLFELQRWTEAAAELTDARNIYEKLAAALSEDEAAIYKARMAEIVPSLRFCAYNSGDEAAKQELMSMRGVGNVDDLINQAKQDQAATLQEVEWRGRKMAVKQEQVRLFMIREQEFEANELDKTDVDEDGGYEAGIEAYESLLMDCKDAVQVLKNDLAEDPSFRNRQQVSEGSVSATHFLHTYLCFIKCKRTVERNLAMIEHLAKALDTQQQAPNKKPVKAQDLVRLYEAVIQNLSEMPQLAGLEEDLGFRQETEAKVMFYKAWRCHYIARSFMAALKWPEAMALFQRATVYASKSKADKALSGEMCADAAKLVDEIEGRQFMAHANSILDTERGKETGGKGKKDITGKEDAKALVDRLDVYYEDPKLVKGKPNLADFPPSFTPIPCKPLFFDLAREHLTFPSDVEDKLKAAVSPDGKGKEAAGGASGGWLGWMGGWGGGKK